LNFQEINWYLKISEKNEKRYKDDGRAEKKKQRNSKKKSGLILNLEKGIAKFIKESILHQKQNSKKVIKG
jgi:hypothetical protein